MREDFGQGAAARAIAALLLALILAIVLAGCNLAPGEGSGDTPPDPIFYEIASADGTVEGWMLGTIHALPPDTAWQTPAISNAIGTADLLVVEIAALENRGAISQTFGELATSPGLPPLFERIPPDLTPQLRSLLERSDLSANALAATETWAAAITLAQVDAVGDPAGGIDRALINAFGERPVREFEGARAQLAIFDRLPEAQQRFMLAAVVRESEAVRRDPGRLQRAWLAGDAAAIEASTREGFLADPALREALLVARNRRWADKIAPMLAEPPRPLIAVGTAHLVGPEGLVALLEARGYRLRRLRREP